MIDKAQDNIDKAVDKMHKELQEEETAYCAKCRPLFHNFIKRWFEKYPDK